MTAKSKSGTKVKARAKAENFEGDEKYRNEVSAGNLQPCFGGHGHGLDEQHDDAGTRSYLASRLFFLLPYLTLTLGCRYMARLGIILYLHGYARSHNFIVPGSIFPPSLYPRRVKKNYLVYAGTKPRSPCFTSDHSNH